MPKHHCAQLGGMVLQDLGEIQLEVWPEVGLARADFHVRRVLRARGREEAPNWSPPEYVVLFSGISNSNV